MPVAMLLAQVGAKGHKDGIYPPDTLMRTEGWSPEHPVYTSFSKDPAL